MHHSLTCADPPSSGRRASHQSSSIVSGQSRIFDGVPVWNRPV